MFPDSNGPMKITLHIPKDTVASLGVSTSIYAKTAVGSICKGVRDGRENSIGNQLVPVGRVCSL